MRDIKKIGPEIMDEYMYIYLNAYPAFKDLDEDCYKKYEAKNIRDMELDDDVDFYGCFEDGKLVATMKLVSFQMNLFGRMHKAVGLMALGVHPLHKKQGIALEMVRFYEKYAVEHGALVCPLLPFRMDFYRKMGYGLGSRMDEYHLPTVNLPKCDDLSGLRPLSLDEIGEVFAVNDRFCEMNHGMLKKFSEEKRLMEADTATQRMGCFKDGELTGYAAYRFENASDTNYTLNRIVIDELVYFDGETLRKLLGFFRNQADLAQTIVIRSGEEDFYHLFTDPSHVSGYYIPNGYLQTNVSAICNMYKVMDPEAFVRE
ncbi:MAG: GNAT family N-acetyltransferase, partial [Firmicutes bacterium]|nr:GNAT family N-acetyltransferase [Bacillota bacterium]